MPSLKVGYLTIEYYSQLHSTTDLIPKLYSIYDNPPIYQEYTPGLTTETLDLIFADIGGIAREEIKEAIKQVYPGYIITKEILIDNKVYSLELLKVKNE